MELHRWHFIVAIVAGWLCREQEGVIHYLPEENRVLRELMGGKRLRDVMRSLGHEVGRNRRHQHANPRARGCCK